MRSHQLQVTLSCILFVICNVALTKPIDGFYASIHTHFKELYIYIYMYDYMPQLCKLSCSLFTNDKNGDFKHKDMGVSPQPASTQQREILSLKKHSSLALCLAIHTCSVQSFLLLNNCPRRPYPLDCAGNVLSLDTQ